MKRSDVLQIKKLRNEGKTNDQIAEVMKCHPMTVTRWVKKLREAGHDVKEVKAGRRKIDLTNLD